jgi:hypothetical protein
MVWARDTCLVERAGRLGKISALMKMQMMRPSFLWIIILPVDMACFYEIMLSYRIEEGFDKHLTWYLSFVASL